jgi:hypothetical protein
VSGSRGRIFSEAVDLGRSSGQDLVDDLSDEGEVVAAEQMDRVTSQVEQVATTAAAMVEAPEPPSPPRSDYGKTIWT